MNRPGRAFTLIELSIALFILGIVTLVMLNLIAQLSKSYFLSETTSRATQMAHSLLEEILSKRFDEALDPDGSGNWSVLGPDSGETSLSLYDDVDDYNGFSETLSGELAGYSRSVVVTYAVTNSNSPSPGSTIAATTARTLAFKRITVTVTGPGGTGVSLVGLATLANSYGDPR